MTAQSEAALETGLIETLKLMDYEYVQIAEEENLQSNFKRQLERHNHKQLAEHGRSSRQRSLTRYSSTLKEVLASRKPRNFVTFIHWTLPTASAFG